MELDPIILALLFVGVFMVIEGVYMFLFAHRKQSKLNRRLQMLESGADPTDVLSQLRKERDRESRSGGIPLLNVLFKKAAQGNVRISEIGIILLVFGVGAVVYFVVSETTNASIYVRLSAAIFLGYGVVYYWLRTRAKKRLLLFEEQLPDAMELIVRSLRVGHPFVSAINIVAREMPDPIGTEFGLIADEATYGSDLSDSLNRLSDRIEIPDLRFFSVAVNIQMQSGGNLAEILEELAKVIRSRFKLFRKVRAITSEARWSGWFLSLFPLAAIAAVQMVEPEYYDRVADHPFFLPLVILTFVLLIINVIFMRIMVNIKV
jgi:tight adherence protein B